MDYYFNKLPVKVFRMLVLLQLTALNVFHVFSQNVNPDREITIGSVDLSGNKKTLNNIIYRELQFASGDTYSPDEFSKRINQSRLNLLNTSLFNFVTIDTILSHDTASLRKMDVNISVLERWYIWSVPIVKISDRNFNAWLQTHDFTRINYGLDVKWYNFTGRMDELDAVIQFGKNQHFSLAYQDPYIDSKKHFGLGIEAGFNNNREVGCLTQNDKLVYVFKPDGVSVEKYFAVNATFRNDIFTTHQLTIGFRSLSFSDTLKELNPDFSYPGLENPEYLYLGYKLKIDHRDIKYYPLRGWYADLEINKSGLGFNIEKPVDAAWAKTTTRYYSQISTRWYTGVSFIGKISSGAWQPYFLVQGLGYNREYVRGYEYNVIDGKHFGIIRSNLKFALVPERMHKIGFIPTPKFGRIHYALYLTAFADAGYVWQPQWIGQHNNLLPRTLLAGTGLGADLVTYYDKVVRIEYAVNRSGKSAIFIHFIAGI